MSEFTAPAQTTDTLAALAGGDGLAGALNALDDKVNALVTTDITDITASYAELNILDGCTSTVAELNILDGVTADKDELNLMDGCTSTTAELNILDGVTADKDDLNYSKDLKATGVTSTEYDYLDGVTSAIQTQIDGKQAVASTTSVASDATPNPTGGAKSNEYYLTALAAAAEFAAPSGTPANGNKLIVRVLDNGTARALTYNAIYSGIVDTLPSTTTASKTLYMGFIYNSEATKWEMVATCEES